MFHSFISPPCLECRTTGNIKKTAILDPAQPTGTFLDIRTDGVGTGNLLPNQAITARVFFERLHIFYYKIKQLSSFPVGSKLLQRALTHLSFFLTRPSTLHFPYPLRAV